MEPRERYQELCRLCASYEAVKMDIFGHEGKNRQLVDKIQACLPFKIAEDDRLPKCLCYRCMFNLENFYDFRTACVNAVALLERCLPPTEANGDARTTLTCCNDTEILKEKQSIPVLIPEAPIVNPNAALGTPPRLNSDGEADHEIEEVIDNSGTDEVDDSEDRRSEEYEMDMETNPSDFLEMTSIVAEEPEESESKYQEFSSNLAEHTSQQHEVYVCSLCSKAFSSKGHLSLHARIHVGAGDVIGEKVLTDDHTSYKRPYQCDLCHKSYSTAKHRWGHVSTTHRGHPAVTCGYCSRIYSTRTNLEEHIKSRHAGLPTAAEIPASNRDYPTESRYKCSACGKFCSDAMELNLHGRICTEGQQRPLLNVPRRKNEIRSSKTMDSSDGSSMGSSDDGKDYRSAEAKLASNPQLTILKQTLTRGDGLRRNFEEKCTNRRNSKRKKLSKIEQTDLVVEGIKKWYCESCPRSFVSVEELKEHEAAHDADKPYICILCKKDFVLKSSLSRHIQTSHGIDPYPIVESDKCLKKIVMRNWTPNQLMDVIDSYEGKASEFPLSPDTNQEPADEGNEERDSSRENMADIETVFVCEMCSRDFNDRASLWLHIRATHKEYAAFACGVCLKICADNTQLLNHVNMYHGGSKLLLSEQRRYSCTICGRQHDSRKKLIAHVSIHNLDPNYDPANFVQLNSNYYGDNINVNMNINGNDATAEQMFDYEEDGDKVDCYICYKSFPNEDHLIRHQRNAHRSEQPTGIVTTGDPLNSSSLNGGNSSNGTNGGNRAQYHLFFVCELCGSSHPSKWERWLHVSSSHSNETTIKCDREDCGKIFATKSLRNEHVQHHAIQGSSPNTCEICGKLWGSRVDYWKHVMGVHSDTVPLICGVCLKVFPNVLQLSAHVKSKHWPLTNGVFSCDICGRPYSNKSKMSRHRKIHGFDENFDNGTENTENKLEKYGQTRETELSCELCAGLKFSDLEALCNHRRIIHGLFPCDLCNKCYGRTSHLWKHVNRVHKGHEDVTCPYCLKTSASKDHLATHISKIHRYEPDSRKDGRQFKTEQVNAHYCEKCSKGFHKRYLLRRHMKGCQNYRKDPGALLTRCRACERIFKDRASLQKHIENHHSEYTCHLCNETITSKLGIMTHNRVNHMDHPDLTCSFPSCKKLFRTKEDLEAHKKDHRYHTTPNVCDFCGDTVENKLKLKMHVLSLHRNEIGVSCGVCLIPMKDPKELKNHVEQVHSSVLSKPNTCQVCGKQYASKWKAFDHTKKCHGKVFRTCKQCLAVFTQDSLIRDHYETIHNIPKDQLAAFEHRLDIGSKNEDFEIESPDTIVKEEPEDLEYDGDMCDEDSNDSKRKRSSMDTYDCEMCPEMFISSDALSTHYRNMHNTDPERMFKKLKRDKQRRMRGKTNFFCKNCQRSFSTKTLYWNHIENCRRSIVQKDEQFLPLDNDTLGLSTQEDFLKNNNQIKKEEPTSNLNIPDFNLFEDIKLQLSGQRPLPNLMPLSRRTKSTMKCSRKDSRKVYDESTNTECACEVCGKQWPAKKHLWQHLIRFHRAEAAVTCGVCLKLCKDFDDLAEHLKATHEAILSTEGNNFTCKTCGRYHNARSKLLLHMSIHVLGTWCPKCQKNVTDQASHSNTCTGKTEQMEQSKDKEKAEENLTPDDATIEEVEEGEFESEAEDEEEEEVEEVEEVGEEEADTEESEGDSSSEEENESEGESRATGEITYNSESEDSEEELDNLESLHEDKRTDTEKHDTDLSDDDGPPVLSPMVPLLPEKMSAEQSMNQLESTVEKTEIQHQTSPKSENLYEKHLFNNKLKLESETFSNQSDDDFADTKNEFYENSVGRNEDEGNGEIEEYEEMENIENEGNEDIERMDENDELDEYDEEMEEVVDNVEIEAHEDSGQNEDNEENERDEMDDSDSDKDDEEHEHERNEEMELEEHERNEEMEESDEHERNEEMEESDEHERNEEMEESDEHQENYEMEESEEHEEIEEMQLENLQGAVLMVTEDDQILIHQEISDDENENSNQRYVYSALRYSTEEDSQDANK